MDLDSQTSENRKRSYKPKQRNRGTKEKVIKALKCVGLRVFMTSDLVRYMHDNVIFVLLCFLVYKGKFPLMYMTQ